MFSMDIRFNIRFAAFWSLFLHFLLPRILLNSEGPYIGADLISFSAFFSLLAQPPSTRTGV